MIGFVKSAPNARARFSCGKENNCPSEGLYTNQAYATAVILLIIILIINGLSGILANKIGKENK